MCRAKGQAAAWSDACATHPCTPGTCKAEGTCKLQLEPAALLSSPLTTAGPWGWRGAFAARGGGRLARELGRDTGMGTVWQQGVVAHLAMLCMGEKPVFPSQAWSDRHWQMQDFPFALPPPQEVPQSP